MKRLELSYLGRRVKVTYRDRLDRREKYILVALLIGVHNDEWEGGHGTHLLLRVEGRPHRKILLDQVVDLRMAEEG